MKKGYILNQQIIYKDKVLKKVLPYLHQYEDGECTLYKDAIYINDIPKDIEHRFTEVQIGDVEADRLNALGLVTTVKAMMNNSTYNYVGAIIEPIRVVDAEVVNNPVDITALKKELLTEVEAKVRAELKAEQEDFEDFEDTPKPGSKSSK